MAQGKGKPTGEADSFQPKGTLLLVFIFFLLLIILWGSVYLILLSRGVTV
jgi:hypothetical protein